jgi:hypothetical protein
LSAASRSTWRSLLERDLDLTILDLLHTSPPFAAWLFDVTLGGAGHVESEFRAAWHSVIGFDGRESDVEVEWVLSDGTRARLLIEDKIDAQCQPDQARAYQLRAAKYVEDGEATCTATVLIAPAGYNERHAADTVLFDYALSVETIKEWLMTDQSLNARREYLGGFLDHILLKFRRLKTPSRSTANGSRGGASKVQFPDVYAFVSDEIGRIYPQISITNSSHGEWIYFAFPGKERGVSLRYRLRDHWVELILQTSAFDENRLRNVLELHPLQGAFVSPRGESEIAVWRPTEELDLAAELPPQFDRIRGALSTVAELVKWYREQSKALHSPVPANTR